MTQDPLKCLLVPEKPEAFGTTYPVSMEIDNNGSNIYFVGIEISIYMDR